MPVGEAIGECAATRAREERWMPVGEAIEECAATRVELERKKTGSGAKGLLGLRNGHRSSVRGWI
jgi:hypothetical protein